MTCNKPAIRYHGAKFRLAPWIMKFFPPHKCYVEPFGGAAGVMIQKERVYAEVYNDLDGEIVNFFRVIRDEFSRQKLIQACTFTPYARDEFELAWESHQDPIEKARRLVVRAQMGFGSAGASKGSTGFRIDTKREYSTAQHLWQQYPDQIAQVGKRFSGVLIENTDAITVMQQHDSEETLHFVDPPYVLDTRVMQGGSRGCYRHEMSNSDHEELLTAIQQLEGFVVVSGYDHELYNETLIGWEKHSTFARISAGRGTAIRTECVWINPQCQAALNQNTGLFKEIA